MTAIRKYWIALIFSGLSIAGFAQHDESGQQHQEAGQTVQSGSEAAESGESPCGHKIGHETPGEYNAGEVAIHHISDANSIHIVGDLYIPLPCFLYAPGHGWTITTSAAFQAHHHGNGEVSKDGYVLVHGSIMRLEDEAFSSGEYKIEGYTSKEAIVEGVTQTVYHAIIDGECVELDSKSTLDGGVLGGGITTFYDFSITRNVFTMLLVCLLLFWAFRTAAVSSKRREGQAPKGIQNFLEPFYTFIRDEVAKPVIGPKYEKFMPFLQSLFFFILGCNLIGQLPFFPGSANLTGNISITAALALFTFVIVLVTSNRHFWKHTLWMPGVPALLKIIILTPVELMAFLLRPFTLMLRLFANVTAGHIVVLCFVGLIFIFGKAGTSVSGSISGIATSIPLTLFMMALELLVALLQAFIFTILSATYFGMSVEEPHHDHH